MMGLQSLLALIVVTVLTMLGAGCAKTSQAGPRQTVSLDGTWDLAQGSMDRQPAAFDRKIAVPGLIDMAQPAFTEVGRKSPQRQAFWYRRTFAVDGQVPAFATLMIRKARYGTKVWLNGQVVGEHLPCFTPALLDVRPHLKGDGQPNELVIRIGADRDSMPQDMPTGWDFEKYLFIPGIYDSVELILNGGPRIVNVQTVPDIEKKQVRIVAELQAADQAVYPVYAARVSQWHGGRIVGSAAGEGELVPPGQTRKIDFTIDIADCRLWSPEDPFLYELLLTTGGDAVKVRFGMRSFTFDPETKLALLNGRPYYMRGTNVTIYRHFEDADRGDKPWRKEWVRRLHRQFRAMHWTAIRYCIGFPPDFWYDIADEEGFLIQDEFPIWLLNPNHKPPSPEQPVAEKIIPEYIEWMRHRWNHPCVVIWDGQNESQTDETGKAIRAVRGLDLSNRPWENGWAEPNSASDCIESHPYLFIRTWYSDKPFRMSELARHDGKPHLTEAQKKLNVAVIINEYDWLWLDRQGNPTCLTDKVYESLLGKNSTVEQRRYTRARLVAALTEFWRCHRHAAGVLHFCGLGYSRPGDKPRPEGGATSDDFIDIEKLTFEPKFFEYVGESFNPVGLMVNFWDQTLPAGGDRTIQVYVINDLYADWKGNVRLRFMKGDREATAQILPCTVKPLGREILSFSVKAPADRGDYTIVADLVDGTGRRIRSLRDVRVE